MMKKLLLGLLTLLLPSMAFAAYSGDPTPSDILAKNKDSNGCYQISSAEDLYGFANVVKEGEASACGKLIEDIEVNANVLDEDGNLNTTLENGFKAWTPIGTILKPFSGTFDGNNKKISGLYFNNSSGREVGLIGYVTEGSGKKSVSIKDVGVVDSYIKGGNFVGGLVGSACKATVTITNSYIVGDVNGIGNLVGGLVGYIDGSATITITNSYIVGDVKGNYKVGGMVGEAYSSATISITNSYSAGNVNGTNYVGGMFGEVYTESTVSVTNSFALEGSTGKLVGEGTATITSSGFASKDEFNNGTVAYALHNSEGGSSWGQSVGVDKFPLLGKSLTNKDGNAFKTYSITYHLNGGVSSKNQFEFYLAGVGLELPTPIRYGSVFLGWYTNENFSGNVIKKIDKSETGAKTFYAKWKTDIKLVNDCYEIYTADGLYQFAQIVNGEHAGFTKDAAACGKLMKDIVVNENVLDEDGNLNAGDFKAWTPIGNVNNRFEGSFDGNGKKISGLYFNASKDYVGLFGYVQGGTAKEPVSIKDVGVVDSYISGRDYVGGLLGLVSGTVSITNSYSAGRVTGSGNYVGGLVGGAYGSVSITNSYSAGRVTGSGNYVGGLLGSVSKTATITNSFVLEGAAEKQVGYGEVTMTSSGFASKDDFSNGMVAYALHIGVGGSSWGQSVGTDEFPLLGKGLTDKDGNAFKAYTIAYNLNGGSFSKYHFNFYLVGVGKDPLPTPVLAGYSFLGWFANKNFSGNVVTKIEKSEKENKDFYAKWEKPLELVNDCYEIYTADDLYQFARIVNGKHATIAKNTAACGKLMKDIVVNEHVLDYTDNLGNVISGCATSSNCASSWATIGAYTSDGAKAYSGSFDGNGHTISGLYEKTTYNYVGFFSAIKGAKISNLGIVDSYFYGPKQNNGALVGISVGKDTIEACFSKSFVDGVDNVVGGLVGRSSGDLIIKNSHNEGHVRSTKTIVGGLVGFQEKGTLNISESYNIGFVNGSYNVGGLVGFQEKGTLNISESYNVGSIEGKVSEGGLVGRADAELTIVNAWNAGAISGTGAGEVGGLVGHVYSGNTSVMNSYNVGSLSISSPSETEKYLGGLVARASGSLSVANSYSLTVPVNGDVYNGATKAAETEFHDGTVAYALHDWCETYAADGKTCAEGGKNGAVWGQHVGHDAYPVLSSTYDDDGNLVPGTVMHDFQQVGDCYEIYDADGLYQFAQVVNGEHATIAKDSAACGKLMKDIYVNGSAERPLLGQLKYDENGNVTNSSDFRLWTPIGTVDKPFSGKFDGNNKKISGLYFNNTDKYFIGLFGNVSGGTAKDPVIIKDVGVVDSYIKGLSSVGGLVGYAYHGSTVSITNSYNSGSVTGSDYSVGGLVGSVYSSSTVSITNSYNSGSVTGSDYSVGGLVGRAYSSATVSITNGYNSGSVTGSNSVGGLMGAASSATVSITNGYNSGSVTGSNYVGGLVGAASSATVSITNSYNVGSVTGSGNDVGGLVGAGTATITNGYNSGSVTGSNYVGGLVGRAVYSASVSITNSYNVGSVTGSGNFVGGLVGYAYKESTVSITNSYNSGNVMGSGNFVGGLLGEAYEGSTVRITNSYNVGSVTGSGNFVGGLVGYADSSAIVSITNSYALDGSAGKLVGNSTVSTTSSGFVSEDDFKNGTVAYALHNWCEKEDGSTTCKDGGLNGAAWGQDIGNDDYPTLSGSITVNGVESVKYSISYNLNGGSFSKYVLDFYLAGVGKDSLPTPVRLNSEFLGWYTDENFGGAAVKKIEKSETGNREFYAKWKADIELVNDCYEIHTADDLYEFAQIVNGEHTAFAQNTAACGKLMRDIVVNENVLDTNGNLNNAPVGGFRVWTPIGKDSRNGKDIFSGSFDGNDHTISGLYFNNGNEYRVGLFGYADAKAKVSNVGIVDSYFNGLERVGALVGEGDVTITNCYNIGSVSSVVFSVGGLVGEGQGAKITNSYNGGTVRGTYQVGGLVGAGDVTITNSYNVGVVNSNGGAAGGLVGSGGAIITNSYNIGVVNSNGGVAGGLVGAGDVTITNSYNNGSIEAKGNSAGGLVGAGDVIITNSYNNGAVTGGVDNVGGLVGAGEATITNSYNSGSVKGEGNYVGGLFGFVGYECTIKITNSYNDGSVTGGGDYVGGLLGFAYENSIITITNSFALEGFADKLVAAGNASIERSAFMSETEFKNGTVAYALHDWCETYAADGKTCAEGGKNGLVWGQHVGHDAYPVLSSTFDDAGNLLPGVVEFDLDYVLNGGVNAEGATVTHTYGTPTTLPVSTRGGYTFEGWYEGADFAGDKVESISADAKITATSQSVNENTVWTKKYYAKWSDPIEYTVTYNNVNGAINTNSVAYTVETGKVNLSALTRKGYKFLGWFDGEGDDALEVKKIAGGEIGNVILYARWSIESYEIKVAVNDSKMGTVSGAGSYEYGAEITLVATAADGYKFSNWEDDAKASATRKVTVSKTASYKANFEKVAASSSSAKQQSSSSVIPGSSSSVIPGSDPESGSKPRSSSSAKSRSSSSSAKVAASSSSAKRSSSSSAKKDAIVASAKVPMFSVTVMGRNLQIAGAPVGEKIAILDMQGRVLSAGLASTGRVDAANFNVAMPRSGSYMVRIGNQVQRVNVK